MLRPVEVLVMVGATGGRSLRCRCLRLRTRWPSDFSWVADSSARARGGL
jgi:hypothetical protein